MILNESAEILIIILTAVLVVFLIVGIILLIKLIQVVSKVKKISYQVEDTTRTVHEIAKGVKSAVTPAVITKAITNIVSRLTDDDKQKKSKKKEEE